MFPTIISIIRTRTYAFLGKFACSFVLVVPQQFNDSLLIWSGSIISQVECKTYPQTSLMRDRTALVFCERNPFRRARRGAISRLRTMWPLFSPVAMPRGLLVYILTRKEFDENVITHVHRCIHRRYVLSLNEKSIDGCRRHD